LVIALFALAMPAQGQQAFLPPSNVQTITYNNFVRVSWSAEGGNLFYCVDTGFSNQDLVNLNGSWSNWGCGTTGTSLDLNNLACGRIHYLRVWAAGIGTSGYSETLVFQSQPCIFSPPTNPRSEAVTSTSARLLWDRGLDNYFYCVDLALSSSDLLNLTGSWFNTGCGTTATSLDVNGLSCDTTYHWRVWSTNATTPGYTPIASFHTPACDYSTAPVTINSGTPGTPVILTDVRVGAHPDEGFDRIVFEFEGALPAETKVQYQGSVSQCGSGQPVSLPGAGNLVVRFFSAQAHDNSGNSTIDSTTVDGTGASLLQAIETCDFEGVVSWAIGTDEIAGFRVTTLSNPSRVVVDILR
jgi:hypothetical protein